MNERYSADFSRFREFVGKHSLLVLSDYQSELMRQILGDEFEAEEYVCFFDYRELEARHDAIGDDLKGCDHFSELDNYFDLGLLLDDIDIGNLVPFAALNIGGRGFSYDLPNTFKEMSNHGLLCFDFTEPVTRIIWFFSGKRHDFASSVDDITVKIG